MSENLQSLREPFNDYYLSFLTVPMKFLAYFLLLSTFRELVAFSNYDKSVDKTAIDEKISKETRELKFSHDDILSSEVTTVDNGKKFKRKFQLQFNVFNESFPWNKNFTNPKSAELKALNASLIQYFHDVFRRIKIEKNDLKVCNVSVQQNRTLHAVVECQNDKISVDDGAKECDKVIKKAEADFNASELLLYYHNEIRYSVLVNSG